MQNFKNFISSYFNGESFTCPHCNTYAQMNWEESNFEYYNNIKIFIAFCCACCQPSIWYEKKMIYPKLRLVDFPNQDLPDNIKEIYEEAALIVDESPRGACALLRLTLQELMKYLGQDNKKLDNAIAELVKKGLPLKIQKALDIVRIIGNNAVHPNELDINDNSEIAYKLFNMINLIADRMITAENEIEELYKKIPDGAKKAVEKRDSNSKHH